MRSKSVKKSSRRGWKDTQKNIKNKRRTKLALLILAGILTLLVIGQLIKFSHTLLNPWKIDGVKKSYSWNENLTINLVVKNSEVSLLSYIPSEKRITIIKLPDNLLVDVPFNMGKWKLGSVYELGETTKLGFGSKLIEQTVSQTLGIPINGILDFNSLKTNQKDVIENFRKEANIFEILKNLKTDLTLWEILKLKLALSAVRFDKVKLIDLTNLYILDEEVLADGTKVFTGDPVKIDSIIFDISDPKISGEHKSVAIFNATEEPLLAEGAGRLISNLGANVIVVSNANKKSVKSYVLGEGSQTYQRLIQIFDPSLCSYDKKCDKIPPDELGIGSSRADIIVVLGEDYLKK